MSVQDAISETLAMLDAAYPGLVPKDPKAALGRLTCWNLALEPYTEAQVTEATPKVLRTSRYPTPADFVDAIEGPLVKRPTYETDAQGHKRLDRPAGWVESREAPESLDTGQEAPLALPAHLGSLPEPEEEVRGGGPVSLSSLFAAVLDRRGIPRPPGLTAEASCEPAHGFGDTEGPDGLPKRPGRARGFSGGRSDRERTILARLEWEHRLRRGANPECPHCRGAGQVSRLDGDRLAPELRGVRLIATYAQRSVFACECAAAVPRDT